MSRKPEVKHDPEAAARTVAAMWRQVRSEKPYDVRAKALVGLFRQAQLDREALIAKYAQDRKHKHVRELVGTFGPVEGKKTKIWWCRDCHKDMTRRVK